MSFFKIKPWEHQLEAVNRARVRNAFAFFFDVGAGKTGTCINTLRVKYEEQGRLLRTLILGPPIILENWRREFAMHSNIPDEQILILDGSQLQRIKKLQDKTNHFEIPRIVITNYESLIMEELFRNLLKFAPEVLVLDESHKVKDIKAKRTKRAIELSDIAQYRFLLSGTPVLNDLMDLWSQYRILDHGDTFGRNFYQFRGTYFYDVMSGKNKGFSKWVLRAGADKKIKHLIEPTSMSVKKEDCLDLPPLVKKKIEVAMTPKQRRVYTQMRDEFITFIEDKACVAELAVTKALRLQQIVSGFIPVRESYGESSNIKIKDNPRIQALKELLEEITPGHKVLVWAVFKENYTDIRELCTKMKLKFVEVHGGISSAQKQANVDQFNEDEETRVFLGHPGSGGIGINLVAASYSIFYSRSFSLEYDIQAEARNYRGGSERHNKITRIDLVTAHTIDEQILKVLASKQQIGDKVLHDIARVI